MMDPIRESVRPENLYWAWEKAKRIFVSDAAWFDDLEVARFEGELDKELKSIARDLQSGNYSCSAVRPVPHPKGDTREKLGVRQSFIVQPRDQIAWLALVGVIGPVLDEKMPKWSFGNRLHRPVWRDEEQPEAGWMFGPYRHSSGQLYRKFQSGWTLFKHYVALTVREMSTVAREGLPINSLEEELLKFERLAQEERKMKYLLPGYWMDNSSNIAWMGIDFEKFYPRLNVANIAESVISNLPSEMDVSVLRGLVCNMLSFPINHAGTDVDATARLGILPLQASTEGLPTGLFVSGFLANVAMLDVDRAIAASSQAHQIAHFRYVDDHILLGRSVKDIVGWISHYEQLLEEFQVGAKINKDKFEPETIRTCWDEISRISQTQGPADATALARAEVACRIDPLYPTPLLTATLNKVSQLASLEFELLDDQEKAAYLSELEHLMLADINATELPHATRRSFAAALLTRLVPEWAPNSTNWVDFEIRLSELLLEGQSLMRQLEALKADGDGGLKVARMLEENSKEIVVVRARLRVASDKYSSEILKHRKHFSGVVRHALHQHPSKAKLWQRLLEFGYRTGVPVSQALIDELNALEDIDSAAARYLRAFVIRSCAELLLRAVSEVVVEERTDEARQACRAFAVDVLCNWPRFLPQENRWWFETRSSDLMRFAAGTARFLSEVSEDFEHQLAEAMPVAEVSRAIRWNAEPRQWARETHVDLSVWVWWLERQISLSRFEQLEPSLQRIGTLLAPSDVLAVGLWLRYPSLIPESVAFEMIAHPADLSVGQEGWFFDLLGSRVDLRRLPRAQVGRGVRRLWFLSKRRDIKRAPVRTLDDWILWAANRYLESPQDPRVGEWTALTIAIQAAEAIQSLDISSQNFPFHPANFLVPEQWFATGELFKELGQVTWEEWRAKITGARVRLVPTNERIADERMAPTWTESQPGSNDGAAIHGIGLLFLFLLRRSKVLPPEWNPLGHQRAWPRPIRKIIATVGCSSWSRAILEQCLLPRGRETFLLKAYESQLGLFWADDALFDSPPILDLSQFVERAHDASSALRQLQISMPGHAPRQIVPIVLFPMVGAFWTHIDD
jgi:hypothetical protein